MERRKGWIEDGTVPKDLEVVVAEFKGYWPRKSTSGIMDLYVHDGKWFNIPEKVEITRWMYAPEGWKDNKELPEDGWVVVAHYTGEWKEQWGSSGFVDLYVHKGKWFNVPDNVKIEGWFYIPGFGPDDEPKTLPQYMRISIGSRPWTV